MNKKIDRYQVLDMIGQGAMGTVYKAHDPNIGRIIAVKTLRFDIFSDDEEKEEFIARFKREAQLGGNLNHRNIVTIHDMGYDKVSGDLFIIMEYIEGKTLKDILKDHRNMSISDMISIIEQIADALDYAHSKGIIHRDIKPANIIVMPDKTIKIADFGIAKISGSDFTQAGKSLGTPSYMSPEQVLGKDITYKSDIFSFGVLVYEIITGRKAFDGDNITSIVYQILNEKPSFENSEILSKFHNIINIMHKVLQKDDKKRFETAKEFVKEIKEALLEKDHDKNTQSTYISDDIHNDNLERVENIGAANTIQIHSDSKIVHKDKKNHMIITIILLCILLLSVLYIVRIRYQNNEHEGYNISFPDIQEKINKDTDKTAMINDEYGQDFSDLEESDEKVISVKPNESHDIEESEHIVETDPESVSKALYTHKENKARLDQIKTLMSRYDTIQKGNSSLRNPRGFCVIDNLIYITENSLERGDPVIILDKNNRDTIRIFNEERLDNPSDIKLNKRGMMDIFIITDTNNGNIKLFDKNGHLLNYIEGEHKKPLFLVSNITEQTFYLTDFSTGHIYKYDTSGKLLYKNQNKIRMPMGIEKHNELLYIICNKDNIVYVFNEQLIELDRYDIPDEYISSPIGIRVVNDLMLITDSSRRYIIALSMRGDFIGILEREELRRPYYIKYFNDKLYISDYSNGQIYIYGN